MSEMISVNEEVKEVNCDYLDSSGTCSNDFRNCLLENTIHSGVCCILCSVKEKCFSESRFTGCGLAEMYLDGE